MAISILGYVIGWIMVIGGIKNAAMNLLYSKSRIRAVTV
jgi:hypothetical protein